METQTVCGTGASLPRALLRSLAEYRHRVFVERLGWRLTSFGRMEQDEFDLPTTHYAIVMDARGDRIIGCARLLPTSGPYLLSEVFPQLMPEHQLPRSARTWEISRFASSAFLGDPDMQTPEVRRAALWAIVQATFQHARNVGADELVCVASAALARLMRTFGLDMAAAKSPMVIEGQRVGAFWVSDYVSHLQAPWPPHRMPAGVGHARSVKGSEAAVAPLLVRGGGTELEGRA